MCASITSDKSVVVELDPFHSFVAMGSRAQERITMELEDVVANGSLNEYISLRGMVTCLYLGDVAVTALQTGIT